jgi:photosystem II protein
MAQIQFAQGIAEEVIPNIRLTRSSSGEQGRATFSFDSPKILSEGQTEEITGMYLVDEEGEIITREVKGKFINGKPQFIEAVLILNNPTEWERFMRFMERYAQENGMEFVKS